jgi:hypothetical protein
MWHIGISASFFHRKLSPAILAFIRPDAYLMPEAAGQQD